MDECNLDERPRVFSEGPPVFPPPPPPQKKKKNHKRPSENKGCTIPFKFPPQKKKSAKNHSAVQYQLGFKSSLLSAADRSSDFLTSFFECTILQVDPFTPSYENKNYVSNFFFKVKKQKKYIKKQVKINICFKSKLAERIGMFLFYFST